MPKQSPKLFPSPSSLPAERRAQLVEVLNRTLVDGLDLHSQIKVAHWNVKGAHFAALHPLFETFAIALGGFNDQIAERGVTLGGLAVGTARQVARASRLSEPKEGQTRDLALVAELANSIDAYLEGARGARELADELGDGDSVDLLTAVVSEFEKNSWMLRASLES